MALIWAAPASAGVPHTVQPGETLWSIAAANNLSTRYLAAANGLSETRTWCWAARSDPLRGEAAGAGNAAAASPGAPAPRAPTRCARATPSAASPPAPA